MSTVTGMNDVNQQAKLGPWLRRFFTEYIVTERNLAVNTRNSYRDTFRLLLPFIKTKARKPIERLLIQDIASARVLEFLNHIENERGCTVQTRNLRLSAIRTFARYVSSREPQFVEWATSIRSIATKKTQPLPLSWLNKEEMEALIGKPDARSQRSQMEYALLLFLYNTGARVSEVTQLKVGSLKLDQGNGRDALVTLHGKGGRTRQCPLWQLTEKTLAGLIQNRRPEDPVFTSQLGQAYTRYGIYRLVERRAAAVPALANRKVTPHSIRHSSACQLLRAGVDLNTIRAWLGHVSLETTNVYVQIDWEMKSQAMQICDTLVQESARPWKPDTKLMAFLNSL